MKKPLLFGIILTVCVVIVAFVFAQFYPEGMISYWKFEEGSGPTALDSADANDGTLVNGPAWTTTGKVGGALSFDGENDYVEIIDTNPSLNLGHITVSAWIFPRMPSGSGAAYHYIDKRTPGPPWNFEEYTAYVRGNGQFEVGVITTGGLVYFPSSTGVVNMNEWSHVAFTWDGGTLKVFHNGTPIGQTSGSGNIVSNSQPIILGTRADLAHYFFDGLLDEVAIYDRALSTEEIVQHYLNGLDDLGYEVECVPSGMVSWWPGDGYANDITDGNDGTLKNGATYVPGKVDLAFSFDGLDDFVEIPDSDSLDTGTQFTIDAWFNTNDVDKIDPGTGSPTQTIIMYGYDPEDGKNNPLSISDGKLSFVVRGYGLGFEDLVGTTSVNNNTWYHAAVTYDGTTAKLYLNGALEDSKLSSMNMNTNSRVTIGRYQNPRYFNKNFHFDGLIDEVEIFNRALPASEIQAIYDADSTGKCKEEVVIEVEIDIKPGSNPNCFNSNNHGVIPVAILGSEDFDVSIINPFSVELDGQAVRLKGKSGNAGSLEDVNGDGFDDLVVQIVDTGYYTTSGSTTGVIRAQSKSYAGVSFIGQDTICITQD